MTDKTKNTIRRVLIDARDSRMASADSAIQEADKAGCNRNRRYALIQYAATNRREAADIDAALAELEEVAKYAGYS